MSDDYPNEWGVKSAMSEKSDVKPATLEEVFERFLGPVSGWPSGLCNTIADMLGDKDARIAELVEKAKGQTHYCPECERREKRIAELEARNNPNGG